MSDPASLGSGSIVAAREIMGFLFYPLAAADYCPLAGFRWRVVNFVAGGDKNSKLRVGRFRNTG